MLVAIATISVVRIYGVEACLLRFVYYLRVVYKAASYSSIQCSGT